MKPESIVVGIAGALFGLLCGWMLGAQQAAPVSTAAPQVAQAPASPAAQQAAPGSAPAAVDPSQVQALERTAQQNPRDSAVRAQLGNLYFDAERYDEAIKWYAEALALSPKDVNLSTDLGISYYYTNQPDRALQQFDKSLALDPKHVKTLWNVGVVKAFGKQDLEGAQDAWQQVIKLAPESPEGQQAKMAIERVRAAHPDTGSGRPSGS
jgi:tetratricopeptide (TPR) repeat protein